MRAMADRAKKFNQCIIVPTHDEMIVERSTNKKEM